MSVNREIARLKRFGMLDQAGVANLYGQLQASNIIAAGYRVALRASQPGYGNLTDQSNAGAVLGLNAALFPPTWTATEAGITVGTYRSPTVANGLLYKCTAITTGSTAGAQPAWPIVIGNTVVDGGVTWTAEAGPWGLAQGVKTFRSVKSSQLGVPGSWLIPKNYVRWNLADGQSLIVSVKTCFDWTASAQGNEIPVISTVASSGSQGGIHLIATALSFNDIRIGLYSGTAFASVTSGHTKTSFARRPLDGQIRTTTFMVDGTLKRMYAYSDGIAYTQNDMFDAGNPSPHDLDVSALNVGSTLAQSDMVIGGRPGSATTYDLGLLGFDMIVLDRPLPANLAAIAAWFSQRDSLLPHTLTV